jgi:hypothetical protein
MSLCVIPDFQVFHSILRRELSFTGVWECRNSYNILVNLTVKHNVEIILPKLIEDKVKNIITEQQKPHFYALIKRDNSTSALAGYDYNTCLARTAKTNSYEKKVIILTTNEKIYEQELIEKNKKIIVLTPEKFITQFKIIEKLSTQIGKDGHFIDFLTIMFFANKEFLDKIYEIEKKG